MRTRKPQSLSVAVAALVLAGPALATDARAQVTKVSLAPDGTHANRDSFSAVITPDGRFIAFESAASNLVPGDTNDIPDVFVVDRLLRVTTRVSVGTGGIQAVRGLFGVGNHGPGISADGRFVVFQSASPNLVPGGAVTCAIGEVSCQQAYLHDRVSGETKRVSVALGGEPANGGCEDVVISADGSTVVFTSYASNLGGSGTLGLTHLYFYDVATGVTTGGDLQVGLFDFGSPTILHPPSVSANGRRVAFAAPGTLPGDLGQPGCGGAVCSDVYVLDRDAGIISRVSVNRQGLPQQDGGRHPRISADGRFVAFASAGEFGPRGAASGTGSAIYVRDLLEGATSRLVGPSPGACPAVAPFVCPTYVPGPLSADGATLSFATDDFSLIKEIGPRQTFLVDRLSGATNPLTLGGNESSSPGGIGASGRPVVFSSRASNLVSDNTSLCPASPPNSSPCFDVFLWDPIDDDGDTMTNDWETFFGLNPASAADATLDSDADGQTNAEEFAAGTHPTGLGYYTRYFAEGAATDFFDTRISVANPSPTAWASVLLRFVKSDGSFVTRLVAIAPERTYQLLTDTVPELAGSAFSTAVETDVQVVADRLMWWGPSGAYGAHAERSLAGLSNTWYFAEGATHSGFDLFFLVLNPNATPSSIRARYLLPNGSTLERTYAVPARSRFNIWVDQELFGGVPALANTDVATVFEVQNGVPVMVERAMYLTTPGGPTFGAGHASAGSMTTAHRWFFGEGATGAYFDEYLLVANPSAFSTTVRVNYLLESGTAYAKDYVVGPRSRFTIWVDDETIPGQGKVLADVALSIRVDVLNGDGVVAERSMWWPGPTSATWHEAHNVLGSPTSATRWGFAEGAVSDGPNPVDTYFLIGNDEAQPSTVRVRLLFTDATPPLSKIVTVGPRSRLNFNVRQEFPTVANRQFGAVVESVDFVPVPIVVERAVYNDANGVRWAAGTAALGTPIP